MQTHIYPVDGGALVILMTERPGQAIPGSMRFIGTGLMGRMKVRSALPCFITLPIWGSFL